METRANEFIIDESLPVRDGVIRITKQDAVVDFGNGTTLQPGETSTFVLITSHFSSAEQAIVSAIDAKLGVRSKLAHVFVDMDMRKPFQPGHNTTVVMTNNNMRPVSLEGQIGVGRPYRHGAPISGEKLVEIQHLLNDQLSLRAGLIVDRDNYAVGLCLPVTHMYELLDHNTPLDIAALPSPRDRSVLTQDYGLSHINGIELPPMRDSRRFDRREMVIVSTPHLDLRYFQNLAMLFKGGIRSGTWFPHGQAQYIGPETHWNTHGEVYVLNGVPVPEYIYAEVYCAEEVGQKNN